MARRFPDDDVLGETPRTLVVIRREAVHASEQLAGRAAKETVPQAVVLSVSLTRRFRRDAHGGSCPKEAAPAS